MTDDPKTCLPFIPGWLDDLKLAALQMLVYVHVARRAGDNGEFWESIPNCAAFLKLNAKTVRRSLHELVEIGLLEIVVAATYHNPAHYRLVRPATVRDATVRDATAVGLPSDATKTSRLTTDRPTTGRDTKVPPEGSPIKGEVPPLSKPGPKSLTSVERVSAEKALERAEAELAELKSQVEGGYPLNATQKLRRAELKEDVTDRKVSLGWKA